MSINLKTSEAEINAYIVTEMERISDALIYNLQYVGERCVNAARDVNTYKDQTGNLRSSVGYVLVVDGRIHTQSEFEVVKTGGKGAKNGRQYAKELARQFPEGIALIVVAGMHYAAYVSAKRDVIDSAEMLADELVPKVLKELGFK